MRSELEATFVAAAQDGAGKCAAGAAGGVLFGFSLAELLKRVAEKAVELGREYRVDIEMAARGAVDKLIALDIPGIPEVIEAAIDASSQQLAYDAIGSLLDALLGEAE